MAKTRLAAARCVALAIAVASSLACMHCTSNADFTGTYVGALTTTVSCPNEPDESTEASTILRLTQNGDTIALGLDACPNAQAIVSGVVADVQTIACSSATDSEGATSSVSFTGGTISLPAESVVIVDVLASTVVGVAPSTTTCTTTVTGVFRKV